MSFFSVCSSFGSCFRGTHLCYCHKMEIKCKPKHDQRHTKYTQLSWIRRLCDTTGVCIKWTFMNVLYCASIVRWLKFKCCRVIQAEVCVMEIVKRRRTPVWLQQNATATYVCFSARALWDCLYCTFQMLMQAIRISLIALFGKWN